MQLVKSFLREEEGQDVVEYGLVIGLISLVAFVGSAALGGQVQDLFTSISTFVGLANDAVPTALS